MRPSNRWKGILKLAAALGALLALFLLVLTVTQGPIRPVSVEQVWDTLESHGYTPVDVTQTYQKQWNDVNGKLLHAVAATPEDFTFQFFIFDSDDSAAYVYGNYRSQIRDTRYGIPNTEHDTRLGNCVIYWIKTHGTYTVCVRAANTMLFACCDQEEPMAAINELVNALGYFPR